MSFTPINSNNQKIREIIEHLKSVHGVTVESSELFPNMWVLDLKGLNIHITFNPPWVNIATVLMDDIKGEKSAQFYKKLLQLSQKLNGVKIGVENNYISLYSEHPSYDVNIKKIVDQLIIHYYGHKEIFPRIIKFANSLGLKLKKND